MATNRQISSLIAHSLNNDKKKVFEVVEEIVRTNKNKNFVNNINSMIELSKFSERGNWTTVDVILNPDRDYRDYLFEAHYSEYQFENVILSEEKKEKILNWIKELKNLEFLSSYNLPLQTRALFFWDTGVWKTMTAYTIAHELNKPMLILKLSSIISSKLWETSKNLNFVFQVAQEKDAIIFLDEIDFIWAKRDSIQDHWEIRRTLLSLIQILDLIPKNLIVIAATNMIDSLDPAITRRFWLRIQFDKPNEKLIWKFLWKLSNQYSFKIGKSSISDIKKYLLWNNYYDIQTIVLNAFKNKLLHWKRKKGEYIVLNLCDIKKYKYID